MRDRHDRIVLCHNSTIESNFFESSPSPPSDAHLAGCKIGPLGGQAKSTDRRVFNRHTRVVVHAKPVGIHLRFDDREVCMTTCNQLVNL